MSVVTHTPRLGFLGVGWIGRHRMRALLDGGLVQAVAIADVDAGLRAAAAELAPEARLAASLDDLLDEDLDGIVIATPSALHADQAVAALERGLAVFCQKPLGRDAAETRRVLDAARAADRLLGVDLSYRHTAALQALRAADVGEPFALDLVFHNAYGPDKPWFTQKALAGGGCLVDLGTHLVDLALWVTGAATATVQAAAMRHVRGHEVEDYAIAQLDLDGVATRLACSWFLPAGRDCVFECTLYGSDGAVSVRDVGGSFYDFRADLHRGTRSEPLAAPPDDWGGRAIAAWAARLAADPSYDPAAAELETLAAVIDAIYARAGA